MQEDFELVLVRHAEAQNYSPDGDAGRRLTEAGHAAARRLGQAFVAMEWTWSHALVSPYVRAQQTCEHAQDALSELFTRIYQAPLPTPEECALLTPGGDVAQLAHRIAARGWGLVSPAPRVIVFGHNPTLEALAGLLLTGDARQTPVTFGTATALHLLINAPSPIDSLLVPLDAPELPTAVLLGSYDQARLAALAGEGV
jgi:phosphohistidine phosphatase